MRSSPSVLAALLFWGACGTDAEPAPELDPACATSTLTYDNFGGPFMLDWCRGCHSSGQPDGMRQGAPLGVDFDDRPHVLQWSTEIEALATGTMPSMPPAAGPSVEERAMLAEWVHCGAR